MASAVGVTVNDPEPFVIVKFPDELIKSPGFVTVQYKVIPGGTFVAVTVKVRGIPSFIVVIAGVTVNVHGCVRLVSLIVS